jgi:hypothetical protein
VTKSVIEFGEYNDPMGGVVRFVLKLKTIRESRVQSTNQEIPCVLWKPILSTSFTKSVFYTLS